MRIRLFIFKNEIRNVVKFTNFRFLLVYTLAVESSLNKINFRSEMTLMTSDKKTPKVLLTQIEDALEERQRKDRREYREGIPQDVPQERRKNDRRDRKAAK